MQKTAKSESRKIVENGICSKLKIKTPERRQCRFASLLLTLNRFHTLFFVYIVVQCWHIVVLCLYR